MTQPPEKSVGRDVYATEHEIQKQRKSNLSKNSPDSSNYQDEFVLISSEVSLPLHSPQLLKAYEQYFPGSAERILRMAELDQKHLQEMELNRINYPHQYAMRGQFFWIFCFDFDDRSCNIFFYKRTSFRGIFFTRNHINSCCCYICSIKAPARKESRLISSPP
jgi:uncharacterized membrane protein